jgi:hypothetical protein
MPNRLSSYILKGLAVFPFLFFCSVALSQELKIGEFKHLPYDVSGREHQVLDINGNACALIKIRTGLNNVNFYSNLSVEKVERKTGEYWVWVSPGSKQLRIAVNDFPLLDFELPEAVNENSVYIVILIAIMPEKIVFRDTAYIQPHISFTTTPEGANVYINDIFYGTTPLKTNIADSLFRYRLEKRRFTDIEGTGTLSNTVSGFSHILTENYYEKRFFVQTSFGVNSFRLTDRRLGSKGDFNYLTGITLGKLGKTGYYLSAYLSYKKILPDFKCIRITDTQIPIAKTEGYFYRNSEFIILEEQDRFNLLRITGGITQQISKKSFLLLGAGFSERKFYKVFSKSPYDILLDAQQAIPVTTSSAYGLVIDQSYRGLNFDLGLVKRFGSSLIMNINYTMNLQFTTLAFTNNTYRLLGAPKYIPGLLFHDIKIGLGYLF